MKPSESHKSWLTQLAHRYHEALTEETRSYLASRALGPDVVNGALLGLVSDPDPAHEQYRGRLSIPFLTPTGVVSIRFRCLEDHRLWHWYSERPGHREKVYGEDQGCEGHGKYEGVAGAPTYLYNVQALHDADDVVGIAEGELDALVATSAGLPTVGCSGSNNWKPFYYRLFDDFQTVYLLGDGDSAGRQWASKLTGIPGAVSRVQPPGQDVTTHVLEVGAEAWLASVRS